MSLKSMIVFLDDGESAPLRLNFACRLAKHHGAHLTALALSQQIFPFAAAGIDAGAASIDVGQMEEARQRAERVADDAKAAMQASGLPADARWCCRELSGIRDVAGIQGRFSELTIVGQPVKGHHMNLREWALEGALFHSGRPLLLVPDAIEAAENMRHIIVAWDASKEAARALGDAAPFIAGAEKVSIVIVDPKPDQQEFGDEPGADIAPILARHCSNVVVDRIPSSGGTIAEALLERSTDAAGSLIVMGGYGHSRLRETIFGGVTRDMIQQTTLPLLLSH